MSDKPWYADGLRFSCTQCGNCCSGASGFVWVTQAERRQIVSLLGQPEAVDSKTYFRKVGVRYSLVEHANGDCIFLKSEGGKRMCGIYPARPLQCRTWPFWNWNLRTPQAWSAAATDCPGMNKGPLRDFVAIEEVRVSNSWEGKTPWSKSTSAK